MDSVADLVNEPALAELADDETWFRVAASWLTVVCAAGELGPLAVRAEVEDGRVQTVESSSTRERLRWSCTCRAAGLRVHAAAAAIETWRRAPKPRG